MPNTVLTQLKSLRDGVAQDLRMDPRYRTLQALDKSIAEITSVLSSAGLLPAPSGSSLTTRLNGLGPAADPLADPALPPSQGALPEAQPAGPASSLTPPNEPAGHPSPALGRGEPSPGFKDGTVGAQPAVPEHKASVLKPVAEIAAVAALAGGVLAGVMYEEKTHATGAGAPGAAALKEREDGAGEHAGAAHDDEHAGDDADADADAEDAGSPAGAAHEHPSHEHTPHEHESTDQVAEGEPEHAEAEDAEEAGIEDDDTPGEAADHHAPEGGEPSHPAKFGRAPVLPTNDAETPHGEAETPHGEAETPHGEAETPHGEAEGSEDVAAVVPKGKAGGYVPMAAREGAPQYAPGISVKFGKLPNKVDLRPLMTPVEDQGQTSSCVANAVAGAYEYWIKKASKKDQPVSRLFVYYNARWRDDSQDKDEGSVIQLAMEGLQKFGACAESVWPFDPRLILKKPGADAYQDGAPYRVHDMAQVPLKLEAWKQALAEGKPIIFGIELFGSFDECTGRGGVVPMPAPDDIARKKHSGHSMCAVGYSESEKVFIVRNSWGADFGDKGYCYMPYDYILNPKFNDGDCWVFVPKVPSQPPRETWLDDVTPVTNGGKGVDFAIQPFRIEDYERIAIDLFAKVRRPWNPTVVTEYGENVSSVSGNLFSELEGFNVKTFLETTAILAGVGVTAEVLSSEFHESASSQTSLAESEEDAEEDTEQDADDAQDDAEDKDDEADEAEDDEADDAEDDKAEDDKAEGEGEADDEDSEDADEAGDDEDGEGDDDAEDDAKTGADDDKEDDEDGDADAEGDDAEEDDAEGDDDAEEDDGEEDGGDDDGGGDDDSGDDE